MEKKGISSSTQFLTFRLDKERYAIDVQRVREVLEVPRITRVPRMPEFISGVINLRGNVVPVMDLRQKFGLGKTPITQDTSIVVTEITDVFSDTEQNSLVIGIFSDSVEQVVEINLEDIEDPPVIGTAIDTSFIRGMGRIGEEFVIILKLASILSEKELYEGETTGEVMNE